ncbi:MAG: thioredoxin domain-containing protein [Desulfobacterales bacterium]
MMKTWIRVIVFCILASAAVCGTVYGKMELSVTKEMNLDAQPLDIAVSEDGAMIYILAPGEILIYENEKQQITERFPVDKGFDRIACSGPMNALVLTNSQSKAFRIIEAEQVFEIPTDGSPFRGKENAAVTLAVFDDYQCPYCSRLEPLFREVMNRYPDDVKVVIKNFPLSSHPYARKAAQAALAADRQGKYAQFHEKLFENYRELNDAKTEAIAAELGLDMEKFKADRQLPEIDAMIARDMEDGNRLGVRGTPTLYLNGKQMKIRNPNELFQKVEAEIKKKKAAVQK